MQIEWVSLPLLELRYTTIIYKNFPGFKGEKIDIPKAIKTLLLEEEDIVKRFKVFLDYESNGETEEEFVTAMARKEKDELQLGDDTTGGIR